MDSAFDRVVNFGKMAASATTVFESSMRSGEQPNICVKEADDQEGTAAKHKAIHEQRGMDFLSRHGKAFGLSANEISAGRSIILCTDMQEDIASISFASRQIKFLGKLLASADLLAQLSDQIYLDRILSSKDADPRNHLRRGGIVETVRRKYGSQDCSNCV